LMADSFELYAQEIEKKVTQGKKVEVAVMELLKDQFTKYYRIVNDGDGYSPDWPVEAAKRGLLNLKDTVQTLDYVFNDKNRSLLSRHGILNSEEFDAHIAIDYANYSAAALLEGQCLRDMANKDVIPAALTYQNRVRTAGAPQGLADKLSQLINTAYNLNETLTDSCAHLSGLSDEREGARYAVKNTGPAMKKLRVALDALEDVVDRKEWPYPSYEELLLSRNSRQTE